MSGRADTLESVLDVLLSLLSIQWADMASGGHTLAELLHFWPLQDLAEFWLTNEETLHQRLVAILEVRQHAKFFNCAKREVLRFIDDQQAALAFGRLADQKGLQRDQQLGLGDVLDHETKRRTHQSQGIFGTELGGHQMPDHDVGAVQAVDQGPQQRCLSSTDLTGDHDEALVARNPIVKVGFRTPMLLAAEIEARIRIELEGLVVEPVERFVHDSEPETDGGKNGALPVRIY